VPAADHAAPRRRPFVARLHMGRDLGDFHELERVALTLGLRRRRRARAGRRERAHEPLALPWRRSLKRTARRGGHRKLHLHAGTVANAEVRSTSSCTAGEKDGWAPFGWAEHGLHCVGCCWGLMLALFALGVMSLFWMAVVIFVEEVTPLGARLTRPLAIALVALGIAVAVSPSSVPRLTDPGVEPVDADGADAASPDSNGALRAAGRPRVRSARAALRLRGSRARSCRAGGPPRGARGPPALRRGGRPGRRSGAPSRF